MVESSVFLHVQNLFQKQKSWKVNRLSHRVYIGIIEGGRITVLGSFFDLFSIWKSSYHGFHCVKHWDHDFHLLRAFNMQMPLQLMVGKTL